MKSNEQIAAECRAESARAPKAQAEAMARTPIVEWIEETQVQLLQSQLTATEARLETAKAWLEHSPSCPKFNQSENFIVRPVKQCTCGLDAFLSTLTAEKKDYTPPPVEELHWDCPKCGCCNRFYLGRTKAPCVECGAEKKEEAK